MRSGGGDKQHRAPHQPGRRQRYWGRALGCGPRRQKLHSLSQDTTTAPVQQSAAIDTVIFSRVVNGVAVVGPGSKVAVLFDANHSIVGFDFDWPTYASAGRTQPIIGLMLCP